MLVKAASGVPGRNFHGLGSIVGAGPRSATKREALGKNAQRNIYGVETNLRVVIHSSSSSNLLLDALIQGRSPTKASETPNSLLEVFHDPWRFRNQSLAQLLSDIVGRLIENMESHLEEMPLDENGKGLLDKELINYRERENEKRIQDHSINYGINLLKGLGYEVKKKKDLGPIRELLLEVISLAEIGRRLCDWLEKIGGKIDEDKRVVDLAHFQVVLDLILEKGSKWDKLRREESSWSSEGRYCTAGDIKRQLAKGQRDLEHIRLFGHKEDRDLRDTNLFKASLSGANLSGADFSNANLLGANLFYTNLRGARLCGADLRGTRFRGADLRKADLSGANISNGFLFEAQLREANLHGANLGKVDFRRADLSKANLRGADLFSANLSGARLRGADLSDAKLWWSKLNGADLRGCVFFGAIIDSKTKWEDAIIDTETLGALKTGPFEGLSIDEKKEVWIKGGGKIEDEEE